MKIYHKALARFNLEKESQGKMQSIVNYLGTCLGKGVDVADHNHFTTFIMKQYINIRSEICELAAFSLIDPEGFGFNPTLNP